MKQAAEVFAACLPAIVSTVFALLWWRAWVRADLAERELAATNELCQLQRDIIDLKNETISHLKKNIEIRAGRAL